MKAMAAIMICLMPSMSFAGNKTLPTGTTVLVADDTDTAKDETEMIVLDRTHFMLTRETIDRINATGKAYEQTKLDLQDANKKILELSANDNSSEWWWVVPLAGAFATGVWLGSR